MKCGCKVGSNYLAGAQWPDHTHDIVFCPLHAAAEEMKDILIEVKDFLTSQILIDQIDKALSSLFKRTPDEHQK